jgi:hypothetical protein
MYNSPSVQCTLCTASTGFPVCKYFNSTLRTLFAVQVEENRVVVLTRDNDGRDISEEKAAELKSIFPSDRLLSS